MSTKFTDIQLKKLLESQDALNIKYCGENWRTDILPSSWPVTITTELAEFYESAPRLGGSESFSGWKHWKQSLVNDDQNKKVEVIDVLHFFLSAILQNNEVNDILKIHREFNIPDEPIDDINQAIIFTQSLFNISIIQMDYTNAICAGFDMLYILADVVELSPEQLFNGYFDKNAINQKRIEGGYSEGNYKKIDENGQEDNRTIDFK